jgi:type II secretory pathway pseudopilin PulG
MFAKKFTLKKNINHFGFTLLEMIIALGIFIILFSLSLGIYSYSLKAEQRTIQISKLQKEAQLIMEVLAKQIRSSKIDYSYYGGSVDTLNGESELALLDINNNQTVFRFNSANHSLDVCSQDCGGAGIFTAIPAEQISVNNLVFFISPASNPFSLSAPPTEFPRVTVVINLRNLRGAFVQDLIVQQTIPQRLAGP